MQIDCVDPGVHADLVEKYAGTPRVRVFRTLSLDALRELEGPYDCIMLDGDHNWYTVFHELQLIHERGLLAENGTLFLHDVCWPYARRDMYYAAETIPDEFRHPAERHAVVRGRSALSQRLGVGINADVLNAVYEGGPRNGVLTAVEDFQRDHPGYSFFSFDVEWGLGVLLRTGANKGAAAQLARKARVINSVQLLKSAVKTLAGRTQA
jgi:hypothetical protein